MNERRLTAIVAMDRNDLIGSNGALPWPRLPADMRRFRVLTLDNPVIMGRRTLESIGKPLPSRWNHVLSRHMERLPSAARESQGWARIHRSLEGAIEDAAGRLSDFDEAFVIGGAQVYREALPLCATIHLTLVHWTHGQRFHGDTFFPWDALPGGKEAWSWREVGGHDADGENPFGMTFYELFRPLSAT
jgi:dihydrofolate reductase